MPVIESNPEILDGTPVFAGTRVPVQSLVDYIEGGETIHEYLVAFPTVKREQITWFLDSAVKQLTATAS